MVAAVVRCRNESACEGVVDATLEAADGRCRYRVVECEECLANQRRQMGVCRQRDWGRKWEAAS